MPEMSALEFFNEQSGATRGPIDIAPTAAAKPACIEPAAGNRLADTVACRPRPARGR